jgi:transcriptional regulator with XRE-family HTH domain
MKIATAIRVGRKRAGLTQRDLARRAGVPQSTVGRIESGSIQARAKTAEKLLAALGFEFAIEPRAGAGIDRTLIRRMFALSPRQRVEYAISGGKAIAEVRRSVSRRR